jgi:hypothetical protein
MRGAIIDRVWLDSACSAQDNRGHMFARGSGRTFAVSIVAAVLAAICARSAEAQADMATLAFSASIATFAAGTTTATTPTWFSGGGLAPGARIEVEALDNGVTGGVVRRHSLVLDARTLSAALMLPAGVYRVRAALSGYQSGAMAVTAMPGVRREVRIAFAPERGTSVTAVLATTVRVGDEYGTAHQVSFATDRIDALPSARTVWSLLDSAHPYVISDRIDGGGLTGGEPARFGGYGSAWSQTTYQLGGLDVTNLTSGGVPLFYPSLDGLDSVVVASAARGVESAGPGPVVTLVPRRVSDQWTGSIGGALTPRGLQGGAEGQGGSGSGGAGAGAGAGARVGAEVGAGAAPALARFDSWTDGSASAGGRVGRVGSRVGLFTAARVTSARWVERGDTTPLASDVRSFAAHLMSSRGAGDTDATLVVNDETRPYRGRARLAARDTREADRTMLAGVTWRQAGRWSFGGAYQRWSTEPLVAESALGGVVERLLDGPPRALLEAGPSSGRRVDLNTSVTAGSKRIWKGDHELSAGASVTDAAAEWARGPQPAFAELVDGLPARVWDVRRPAMSLRGATTLGTYVSDRMSLFPGFSLRAGVRLDVDRGAAKGAVEEIGWRTTSPRVSARWRTRPDGRLVFTSAYGRYAHRLNLDTLAAGDPAGPSGVVYRWDDNGDRRPAPSELTAVSAIGACCTSTSAGRIDPEIRRPTTREFVIGVEHGFGAWHWSVTGVDRRESNLLELAEVGLTASDYTVRLIGDPGIDLARPVSAPTLAISSRNASSFLRDASLLTNTVGPSSRYQGAEIAVERRVGAWRLYFGGMTYRAEAAGASRGYRADENDQGGLGEVRLDPNASLHARGRLFFDRAYVIKLSGDYRAPGDVQVGVASRYQDGQPFARVVVVEGLGQGTDIVPTYPRGGQRFTYTLTLDVRVRKGFTVGPRRVEIIAEAFNLLDRALEVEEDIVTGPAFRTVTAVQPPRAIRLGARVTF